MDKFIGIDLGTSSVKVVVTDRYGRVENKASEAYDVREPSLGWREIDPAIWWHAVARATRRLMDAKVALQVKGVGITGQMHSTVLLDAEGAPIRPAIMWNDHRTSDLLMNARRSLEGAGENYLARIISTGSPALGLLWMKENEPRLFARIASFVIAPDWIVRCLTGSIGTDWCEASTSSLFDLTRGTWSDVACEVLGIPRFMLPVVQDAGAVVGRVTKDASRACGIPVGVPVIRGTGDNPAAAIPTGCLRENRPVISLGTSGVLMYSLPSSQIAEWGKSVLFSVCGEGPVTIVQMTMQACGDAMTWLTRRVLRSDSYELEDAHASDLSYDIGQLLFCPYLNGDKTIYQNPDMRGAFVGLSLGTSRSDLRRAVMEGLAMGFRRLVDHAANSSIWDEIRVVGGGSRSDLWLRILASVLHRDVVRLKGVEGASQGAAMLAAAAMLGGDVSWLSQGVSGPVERFLSDSAAARRYDERYEPFLALCDALEDASLDC